MNRPFPDPTERRLYALLTKTQAAILQCTGPSVWIVVLLGSAAPPLDAAEAAAPRAGTNQVHYPVSTEETARLLAARGREQAATARRFTAFHDFGFTNRVAQSGITFEHHSVDDALKNWKGVHYDHGSAVAVADVDGDGRLDLYLVNQLGPNQLWRNLGGGKFEDITARSGVAAEGRIHVAASFADIDNDGAPDLFVTTVRGGNVLLKNLGGGRFRDITQESGLGYVGHSSGAVFFDFDRDGLLDLFLCNVGVYTTDEKGRGGFFLSVSNAFRGHLHPERTEMSLLYKNLGGGKFREVSKEMGLTDNGWTGDATVADVNGDGFPDLYVLNMQGDDHFYENVAGKRFEERTAACFRRTPWGSMGAKFFDFNLDGLPDLFVTDMHSDMTDAQSKAGRATMTRGFEKIKSESWCAPFVPALLKGTSNVFGNALYVNQGGGKFEEGSDRLGAETYWPWGLSVGDLNADGCEDAFITAGMGWPFRYAINSVLLNESGRRFFDAEFVLGVEPRAGGRIDKPMFTINSDGEDAGHALGKEFGPRAVIHGTLSTRSSVMFDLDDDGDLDIVTNEMNDRPMVLISNLSARRAVHFLKIKLVGTQSNREGVGATVRVRSGPRTLTQFNDGKSGYLAQSAMPLYFGLGESDAADSIEVLWPSGKKQTVTADIPRNGLLTIREPAN